MAEIKPIRAWHYNSELSKNIENLTSPLFDVVSAKQREKLYQNPYNSIHLSIPEDAPPYENALKRLEAWKKEGIIVQDQLPAIYVYYQYFSLAGKDKEYCRKGFICHIKAYDWHENVILRHENTIPHAVNDRKELLAHTLLHVAPTHGLYIDPLFELETYMDECMQAPLYETEDYQGVRDVLGVIQDVEIIKKFIQHIKDKKIILADGHHRYTGSLDYRKEQMTTNPAHTGKEAYNYHLMYLTNAASDDLRILPTHRLVSGLAHFDKEAFLEKLAPFFYITSLEDPYTMNEVIIGKKWAFGLILKNEYYKIRLKPEVFSSMTWQFPLEVKELDLTVMHYFIFEKILAILGKDQRSTEHLQFSRNFSECLNQVAEEKVNFAVITQDISMESIKKVCDSGYTMPQKSTYFYPKVICGFLFSSIEADEFASLADKQFDE